MPDFENLSAAIDPRIAARLDALTVDIATHRAADDERFIALEAAFADLRELVERHARSTNNALAQLSQAIRAARPAKGAAPEPEPAEPASAQRGKPPAREARQPALARGERQSATEINPNAQRDAAPEPAPRKKPRYRFI